MIEQLPAPPRGKKGWPWTEESDVLPRNISSPGSIPGITIVTPSLNQGLYLEETIRSVLLQNYPNLEYIIVDGGSTDNSVDIIRKYEKWITWWVSEKDEGQSDAINKGFRRATGIYGNWICSDDLLCRNALNLLAQQIGSGEDRLLIGRGIRIDGEGRFLNEVPAPGIRSFSDLVDIGRYWRKNDSIMQQSCLYPVAAFRSAGCLTTGSHHTMDFELWGRLLMTGLSIKACNFQAGIFRWYEGQKTSALHKVTRKLVLSALRLIKENKSLSLPEKLKLRTGICMYFAGYQYHRFRSFLGLRRRLKKLGVG
jgi:glycosyltransferase involved in cell wall biosynthesis